MTALEIKAAIGLACLLAIIALLALVHHMGAKAGRADQLAFDQKTITALQTDILSCHGNVDRLNASLTEQGEAVAALKAASDAKVAAAGKAVTAAQKATQAADKASTAIKAHPPVGTDVCLRVEDADITFLEQIR